MEEYASAKSIESIKNEEVKSWFLSMYHYMLKQMNDSVNIFRDKILQYAQAIRNTEEFRLLDNIMAGLFFEYAKHTYSF